MRNLFTGPNMIEDVAVAMRKLERGELKPRVRALEAERALSRVQARLQHARMFMSKGSRFKAMGAGVRAVLCVQVQLQHARRSRDLGSGACVAWFVCMRCIASACHNAKLLDAMHWLLASMGLTRR